MASQLVGVVEVERLEGEGGDTLLGVNEGTSGRRNLTNEIGDSGKAALGLWKFCMEKEIYNNKLLHLTRLGSYPIRCTTTSTTLDRSYN